MTLWICELRRPPHQFLCLASSLHEFLRQFGQHILGIGVARPFGIAGDRHGVRLAEVRFTPGEGLTKIKGSTPCKAKNFIGHQWLSKRDFIARISPEISRRWEMASAV
jgi:hypothetical protein